MQTEDMIHMANQIAAFFASYPHDEAVAGVQDHLQKFWEKRMRRQIIQYVAEGGAGLHPLVLDAVKRLKPVPPDNIPAEKTTA
jgi:formate dehydrogenase subunit delta